jgi:SP family general alpha glucoside:H+ symporter-like MFS transporter
MSDSPGGLAPPASQNLAQKLDKSTILEASRADADQHEQTVKEAFRQNRKAVFWSMALSAALIMEGAS